MYVRDSDGDPKKISKIYVRDSDGNPREICKIYVRDADGNPKLVYNCTPTTFNCPDCEISGIIPNYYSLDEGYNKPRFSILSDASAPCNTGATGLGQQNTIIPNVLVDKDYWQKTSLYSTVQNTYETLITGHEYFNIKEYKLRDDCEFCRNVDRPTVDWSQPTKYWEFLKQAYSEVENYPLIPNNIIVDWNTYTARDTIYVLMKPLQRKFTKLCTHPFSRPDQSSYAYCPQSSTTVDPEIYPFYNRSILFRVQAESSADVDYSYCGQEKCDENLWGTVEWNSISNCYGGFHQSGSVFVDMPWLNAGALGNCCDNPDPTQDCSNISWSGSTTIDSYECCCGWCCREGNQNDPACKNASCGCCGTMCNCKLYFSGSYTAPEGNPFSFVMKIEDHGTNWTLPVYKPGATANDCCVSMCYGPIDFPQGGTNNNKACREVYQIPPINSLPTTGTGPFDETLGFFKDITVAALLNSTAMNTNTPGGSIAKVRITLPYYVKLHSDFKGRFVEIDSTKYDNFIIAGNTGNLQPDSLSVWETIKGILGITPGNTYFDVPFEQRIWMSSSSFNYQEYTTSDNTAYDVPLARIPNNKIGLWWNVKGMPTEETTHYVVFELGFSGSKCISNIFDEDQLKNISNQNFFIRGIKFYPVERKCSNGKYYKHPTFQSYILPKDYQNYANNFDNRGFIDYYEPSTGQWIESNDNTGGILNAKIEDNFWVYTDLNGVLKKRCLMYVRPSSTFGGGTYKNFLEKYYDKV